MLRTTSMSMTEIALECGFEEPSHFSRTFKTKFGRSPTDYREQDARRDDTVELSTSR
jgi:transcriptional regulator GlxA family with amidase domain